MDTQFQKSRDRLSRQERIEILLEEYRSLNSLLLFRLAAMDRRLPVSVGFMAAAIASMLALPPDSRTALLLVTPASLFWLVRTTVQHAQAKEDHLRRIDEIERTVNAIANESLLTFQSRHPNRSEVPAGRTGGVTIIAVSSGAIAMLTLCLFLFFTEASSVHSYLYVVYVAAAAVDAVWAPVSLSRYRYQKTVDLVKAD